MAVTEHMGNLGARGVEEADRRIMKHAELLEAMKKIHEFIGAVLYRTETVWMGKYMPQEILCSKCEKIIPESEWLQADLVMTVANEGFGNGGAVWTCPKCTEK